MYERNRLAAGFAVMAVVLCGGLLALSLQGGGLRYRSFPKPPAPELSGRALGGIPLRLDRLRKLPVTVGHDRRPAGRAPAARPVGVARLDPAPPDAPEPGTAKARPGPLTGSPAPLAGGPLPGALTPLPAGIPEMPQQAVQPEPPPPSPPFPPRGIEPELPRPEPSHPPSERGEALELPPVEPLDSKASPRYGEKDATGRAPAFKR